MQIEILRNIVNAKVTILVMSCRDYEESEICPFNTITASLTILQAFFFLQSVMPKFLCVNR